MASNPSLDFNSNGEPHHQQEETSRVSVSHSSVISTTETLIDVKIMTESRVYTGSSEQKPVEIVITDVDLVKNQIFDGEIGGFGVEGGGEDLQFSQGGVDNGDTNVDGEGVALTEKETEVYKEGVEEENLGPGGVKDGVGMDFVVAEDQNEGTQVYEEMGVDSVVAVENKNEGAQEYEEMKVDTEGGEHVGVEDVQSAIESVDVGGALVNMDEGSEGQKEGTQEYDANQSTGSASNRESNMGSIVVDLDASLGAVGKDTLVKEKVNANAGEGDSATKNKRRTRKQSAGLEPPQGSEFASADMVWGKVKSHPWWPGQIFNPSYASEKAMKHYKKDRFFVAYFGDGTFAWNEPGSLKPFRANFQEMEKQSIAPAFLYAVNSALDDVSRQVELGMSCSCTQEDIYDVVNDVANSQLITTSGIRGEVCNTDSVDRHFSVTSFEPDKLVKYIKALAVGQSISSDRLGFVISQAQLVAFYKWKGNFHLPIFHWFVGLSGDAEHATTVYENVEEVDIGNTKLKSKQKAAMKKQDNLEEKSSKKERSLTDLMNRKISSGKKRKSFTPSPGTSSPDTSSSFDEWVESKKQRLTPSTSSATKSPSSRAYRVGDRIRSIAKQLSGSSPIFKNSGDGFQKKTFKVDTRGNKLHEVDHIPGGTLDMPVATEKCYSSPDEMLSQLFLAAKDPTKGYSFLTTVVGFFTNFRNSVSSDKSLYVKQKYSGTETGGKRRKRPSKITSTESDDHGDVGDSNWTDMITQSSPEEKSLSRRKKRKTEFPIKISLDESVVLEPEPSHDLNTTSDSNKEDASTGEPVNTFHVITTDLKEECLDGTTGLVATELSGDKKDSGELTPTELILEFTNVKTIPSESDLHSIFSPFGSLKEEIKILKKTRRAVVMFQKQDDADAAYSNACKYSVFGPALVSYELRPSRASLLTTAQSGADATSLEDTTN